MKDCIINRCIYTLSHVSSLFWTGLKKNKWKTLSISHVFMPQNRFDTFNNICVFYMYSPIVLIKVKISFFIFDYTPYWNFIILMGNCHRYSLINCVLYTIFLCWSEIKEESLLQDNFLKNPVKKCSTVISSQKPQTCLNTYYTLFYIINWW